MAIILKSKSEVESIRRTGRIVADILAELRMAVRPGITTADLDSLAVVALKRREARSSTLGYIHEGCSYPASLCTSVNDEVIHSIPGSRVLQEGDVLTLDLLSPEWGSREEKNTLSTKLHMCVIIHSWLQQ